MSKIITSDKGYLHISPFRKQFYRSADGKRHINFSSRLSFIKAGEIDFQDFDGERQGLIDNGYTEVPNPNKLCIRLDYFKESGKWYSEGYLYIDKPSEYDSSQSWADVLDTVKQLQTEGNLPGLIKDSRFEVLVTGSEHPAGYPQIFRLEK